MFCGCCVYTIALEHLRERIRLCWSQAEELQLVNSWGYCAGRLSDCVIGYASRLSCFRLVVVICGLFVWGGGRGSPPPLFEALIEHSTLSLAHCLSSTHYGWLCASLFARETQCVCIFWFGLVFEWGSGKIMTQRAGIFSAFVLPSVYINSWMPCKLAAICHLFPSICLFHLCDFIWALTIWLSVCVHFCLGSVCFSCLFCLFSLFIFREAHCSIPDNKMLVRVF